jgi:hypothetical protein
MFTRLVEKCEAPPFNYSPSTQTLDDPSRLRFYHEHVYHIGHQLTVLNALQQAVMYNEGMHTLADDFSGKYRRINDLMGRARGLRTMPLVSQMIDKYSRVIVPKPGGSIYAELMEAAGLTYYSYSPNDWTTAIDLDRGVTASDVVKLILDDVEGSLKEIQGESGDVTVNADYRMIVNIMSALGFPTLVVPERRVEEDHLMWEFLQFHNLFEFHDNKGIGTDKHAFYPYAGDAESTIPITFPAGYADDWRDWIGWRANASMYGEPNVGASNMIYGVMQKSPNTWIPSVRVYTQEDGWVTHDGDLDLTDVTGVQAFTWSQPWFVDHVWSAAAIYSEETEEEYFYAQQRGEEYMILHDHLGEGLYLALHKKEYGGFDVPLIH